MTPHPISKNGPGEPSKDLTTDETDSATPGPTPLGGMHPVPTICRVAGRLPTYWIHYDNTLKWSWDGSKLFWDEWGAVVSVGTQGRDVQVDVVVDTNVVPRDMDEYNNTVALYFDLDSSGSDIVYSICEYGDGADYYTYTYDIARYSMDEEKKIEQEGTGHQLVVGMAAISGVVPRRIEDSFHSRPHGRHRLRQ